MYSVFRVFTKNEHKHIYVGKMFHFKKCHRYIDQSIDIFYFLPYCEKAYDNKEFSHWNCKTQLVKSNHVVTCYSPGHDKMPCICFH